MQSAHHIRIDVDIKTSTTSNHENRRKKNQNDKKQHPDSEKKTLTYAINQECTDLRATLPAALLLSNQRIPPERINAPPPAGLRFRMPSHSANQTSPHLEMPSLHPPHVLFFSSRIILCLDHVFNVRIFFQLFSTRFFLNKPSLGMPSFLLRLALPFDNTV